MSVTVHYRLKTGRCVFCDERQKHFTFKSDEEGRIYTKSCITEVTLPTTTHLIMIHLSLISTCGVTADSSAYPVSLSQADPFSAVSR